MATKAQIEEVKARHDIKQYLQKAQRGKYICPFCGSGTGSNKTGALTVNKDNTVSCFSVNCVQPGKQARVYDLFDVMTETQKIDFKEAVRIAAEAEGITIDTPKTPRQNDALIDFAGEFEEQTIQNTKTQQRGTQSATEAQAKNLLPYYAECAKRINTPAALSYLTARGISAETAARLNIGYDPAADPAGSGYKTPRLIIPTSASHYIGRRIDNKSEYAKINNKGGKPDIFNKAALYADNSAVFVVEGAFDAMSIEEVGGAAIAINSVNNGALLVKQLQEKPTAAALIICLDNEAEPKKQEMIQRQQDYLRQELTRLNISFTFADICSGAHDANDALIADKKSFSEKVIAVTQTNLARPDNVKDYINQFLQRDIEKLNGEKDRKTGFDNLDKKCGALYSGLYILAAGSSLGKTTFALQLADNIAAAGNDVIFFSMEQSRLELVTKSIARTAKKLHPDETTPTSLDIRNGLEHYKVSEAAAEYKETVADRLNIIEGNFNCTPSFIGEYIKTYKAKTDTRPTIIIDYLQILHPDADEHGRAKPIKETIDSTITMLKQISRNLEVPIIAISSINRANYLKPIDFESLKESGGIEYTADVVWGLQLSCLKLPIFREAENDIARRRVIQQEKAKNPRGIELTCIKNRYGISSYNCYFSYDTKHDTYTPDYETERFIDGTADFDDESEETATRI